jgi:hypothetical protein
MAAPTGGAGDGAGRPEQRGVPRGGPSPLTPARGSPTLGADHAAEERMSGPYGIIGLIVAVLVAILILRLAGIV